MVDWSVFREGLGCLCDLSRVAAARPGQCREDVHRPRVVPQRLPGEAVRVRLVAVTQPADGMTAEQFLVYTARVSNPAGQHNHDTGERLLRYCLRQGHWSVFEAASMTVEVETSRAIAAQILRHRSFTFQEFSQRYAEASLGTEIYSARRQDVRDRQNSIDDLSFDDKDWFVWAQQHIANEANDLYKMALARGIAKECARFLLPLNTRTRLYMTGCVRSWLTYFEKRCDAACQLEHREVALAIRDVFATQFPVVASLLGTSST